MSGEERMEHEWAKDQLAAHLAGGLEAAERSRLEAHLAGCAACRAVLEGAASFDREMTSLFAPARARVGLEERLILGLRRSGGAGRFPHGIVLRIGGALAATLLLGMVGLMIQEGHGQGFAVPGSWKAASESFAPTSGPAGSFFGAKSETRSGFVGDAEDCADDFAMRGRSNNLSLGMEGNSPPGLYGDSDRSLKEKSERKYYEYENRQPERADASPAGKANDFFQPGKLTPDLREMRQTALAEDGRDRRKGGEGAPAADKKDAYKGGSQGQQAAGTPVAEASPAPKRYVIRSGDIEFEVESFDGAVARIQQIVAEDRGFVATVNSEKLPNGKVRGTVVIRALPETLDALILKLRALGDLKRQSIGSQDVTKAYTDIESRLKAARAMEERLLEIIRKGKGEIKDLLQAERELGEWRTKIEALEGEIRYYSSLISWSTLSISLYEKEIRTPFAVTETEKVSAGVEVEDVEAAYKAALAAIDEVKGRITKAEFKKHAAEQYSAVVHCEVASEAAGVLRDRLKQLGHVARLDVDRDQQTEGGSGGSARELKIKKNDAQFFISLYNIVNIAPRETTFVDFACADAKAAYDAVLKRVEKAAGRVVTSSYAEQKGKDGSGTIHFEVKTADAEAVLADIRGSGEVMRLVSTENPDAQNVTRSKQGFQCRFISLSAVAPRETADVMAAAAEVPSAYRAIREAVQEAAGRILAANLHEEDRQRVTAFVDFEIPREKEAALEAMLKANADLLSRTTERRSDAENVVDSKVRIRLTVIHLANVPPRETRTLSIEASDVARSAEAFSGFASELKGRILSSNLNKGRSGQDVASMTVDVPLSAAATLEERLKGMGIVRAVQAARNPQVPEGERAIARFQVEFSNVGSITGGEGFLDQIRKGLETSWKAIGWSLQLVIIGLSFVLPVAAVCWILIRMLRRLRGANPAA